LYRVFCCDISIYAYTVSWFGLSPPFSPSTHSLFLKGLWQVSMFHIHTCIKSILYIFTSFTLFIYPLPPASSFPLTCPVLHSSPHCFSVCSLPVEFFLGISCVNIVYFNQSNFHYYISFPFNLLPSIVQQFSMDFVVSCSYSNVMYFNIINSIILFCFASSPSLL
jgi:hypothetical protein